MDWVTREYVVRFVSCFRLYVSWKDWVIPFSCFTQRYTWFWSDQVWSSFFSFWNYHLCWWDHLKHHGVSVFGLCFSTFARRFAFPLLLVLGLGSSSILLLSSLLAGCPVMILTFTKATLLAPCWASSLLISTAIAFATSITLSLALALFASRWCLRSWLGLFVPPGYGICC